ncbi:hypothetical protein JYB64_07065 [Algoriphagus aestuarii]|nr:hypothetical protein [Algoriphagus aestuarii]
MRNSINKIAKIRSYKCLFIGILTFVLFLFGGQTIPSGRFVQKEISC